MAVIEGATDEVVTQREGLDAPVLTTIHGIHLLGTDACIVAAVIAIAQNHCRVLNATETIGAVVIAAESICLLDSNALLQCLEGSLVGGHGAVLTGSNLLQSPFLQLVATIHFAILHTLVAHAQGTLLEGIDESPGSRQLIHDEQLTLVLRGDAVYLIQGTLSEVLGIDTGSGQYHTQ